MKRTSQLELGPVLREENTHKTQRETLQEEGSRQLATALLRERRISNFSTEHMDEEVAGVARETADDIDEQVLNSFLGGLPGANYAAPVDRPDDLPSDMPTGTLCFVHATSEMYVYIGRRWVTMDVTRNPDGTIASASATVLNERQD